MSKLICTNAIDGAVEWVVKAEMMVQKAIAEKGENCPVTFPDTNYYLPVIYSFTGKKMQTLSDLREILKEARELLPARPADNVWLPYLGNTLDAGVATLFACEVIEACKYIIGPNPVDGIWLGAASDVAVGLGLHPTFEAAVASMTRVGRVFVPDPATSGLYDRLYRRVYRKMYERLRPLYAEIRDITGYPPG